MRDSSLMYTVKTVSMISLLIELSREIIEMLAVCVVFDYKRYGIKIACIVYLLMS